jgi:hypothetical protein
MTLTRRLLLPFAMLLATTSWSCEASFGPGGSDGRELREARELWARRGPVDYEYVVRNQCFCPLGGVAVRVVVVSGSVQSATIVESGQPVPPSSASAYRDVEGLFGVIEEAIERRAVRLDAVYDGTYGFPSLVWIDYRSNVADEEFGWVIEGFIRITA